MDAPESIAPEKNFRSPESKLRRGNAEVRPGGEKCRKTALPRNIIALLNGNGQYSFIISTGRVKSWTVNFTSILR